MINKLKFSVSDGFALLSTRIELPLVEYTAIASKQAEIETFLAQYISTFTTVLPGAFARRTHVSPLAGCTIDMYILFKEEHRPRFWPADLIDKLLVTLKDRYDDIALSAARDAVVIQFDDFKFSVQPGFMTGARSYLVPARGLMEWAEYKSVVYNEALAKANSVHKGKLIPLIRMIKAWNHANDDYFDDYYLELLVKDAVQNYTIDDYQRALCHVFKSGMLETVYKKHDPANLEFDVEGLHGLDNLMKAMLHFKKAYKLASYAVEYETTGELEPAFESWRKLFPGCFPTNLDLVVGQIKTLGIKGVDALKLMQEAKAG
jgi:hypothetical protein